MTATVEWWLVRHGVTAWNREHRYQGHSDVPLLAGDGAELEGLKRELDQVDFAVVYASDLRRCCETLTIARPDLAATLQPDPRLRELNFGDWEGCTYEELKDNETYRAWIDRPEAIIPPGGESWQEFEARVRDIYAELLTTSQKLVRSAAGQETTEHETTGQEMAEQEPAEQLAGQSAEPPLLPHSPLHFPPGSPFCHNSNSNPASVIPQATQADYCGKPLEHHSLRLLVVTHGGVIAKLSSLVQPELDFWDTRVAPGGIQRLILAI